MKKLITLLALLLTLSLNAFAYDGDAILDNVQPEGGGTLDIDTIIVHDITDTTFPYSSSGTLTDSPLSTDGTDLFSSGDIIIPDDGYIGNNSVGAAIKIEADGDVVMYTNLGLGNQSPPAGTILQIQNTGLDSSTSVIGSMVNLQKTAGASDYNDTMTAHRVNFILNQSGGIIGDTYGFYSSAAITDGSVGQTGVSNKSLYGFRSVAQLNGGTVTAYTLGGMNMADLDSGVANNTVWGALSRVDIESGMTTVAGDVYGHEIRVDDDKGASGTVYMLYINEQTGIDYGIYQNGSAPNVLGGSLSVTGNVTGANLNISNWDTAYGWGDWNGNIDVSTDTNLAVSGTLLDLTDDTLSINEGTMTDTKYCTYEAGTGLVCNSEGGSGDVSSSDFTGDGDFLVGTGVGTYQAESGNTARTSLGLGTGDSPTFTAVSLGTGELTAGSINRASGTLSFEIGGVNISSLFSTGLRADRVSVGSASPTSAELLRIYDTTIDTSATFYGIYNVVTKTAGATTGSHDFNGQINKVTFNQSGGTIGDVRGMFNNTVVQNGTADNVYGFEGRAVVYPSGTVTDVYGVYGNLWALTGATVSGDMYAFYADSTFLQEAPTGSVYGYYIDNGSEWDYAFYSANSAPSYLGGDLSITTNELTAGSINRASGTLTLEIGGSAEVSITSSSSIFGGSLTFDSNQLPATTTSFTDGAGASAGTLTNAPSAGDPTKWIPIDDNGTTRYIPAW